MEVAVRELGEGAHAMDSHERNRSLRFFSTTNMASYNGTHGEFRNRFIGSSIELNSIAVVDQKALVHALVLVQEDITEADITVYKPASVENTDS